MIACRYIIRGDLGRKLSNSCFNPKKSVIQLQSCSFHPVVNPKFRFEVGVVLGGKMDAKKRNKVSYAWRQVSTQPSLGEGEIPQEGLAIDSENLQVMADGDKNRSGSQGKGVHDGTSSHSVTFECENEVVIGDDQNISSPCSDEVEGIVGAPLNSAEKHVASMTVASSTGKHSSSIQVCSSLIRFIRGKEGATQRKVEEEMGVQIIFPCSKREDSIIIEGDSAESVSRASERIQDIIDEAVKSPSFDYSHFISLPLAIHPELVDKLIKFQSSILGISEVDESKILASDLDANSSDEELEALHEDNAIEEAAKLEVGAGNEHVRVGNSSIPLTSYQPKRSKASTLATKTSKASEFGIDRSIFIKPKTFHLTVLMLKLWNKDIVKVAAEVLQSVSLKVIHALDSRPVSIGLKGLECMKGSFSKARVLYAPVEEIGGEDRLSRACQVMIDAFVEAGLVLEKDAKHKLKLHATVINARHRKRKTRKGKVDFFDARSIVDQYGSEDWGVYLISEAHLSQRFAFDENGYYHCCASIPFPQNMQSD